MPNSNERNFGKWKISSCNMELNGFLEIDHKEKNYQLKLYSEEPVELPYFTDLVVGKTYIGDSFALVDCNLNQNISTSFIHNYEYRYEIIVHFKYILEGCLIEKMEDLLLTDVDFKLTNLDKWAYKNFIETEFDKEKGYIITAKQLPGIKGNYEDFLIRLNYNVRLDNGSSRSNELKIITDCSFTIHFNEPVALDRAIKIIYQVRDFLTLCSSNRTYVEKISATPSIPDKTLEINMPFKVYGPGIGRVDESNIPKLHFMDVDLNLEKIEADFEKVFRNWFMKNERLKPVIDSYQSIYYQRTSYERHFLNAVQALEAYHRLTRKNEVLPKADHQLRKESILSSIPKEHKEWLSRKLDHSNEPSLHERLVDLFQPIKDPENINYALSYYLFGFSDMTTEDLIKKIKQTRNYNTHFGEDLKKKAVKGEDLAQITKLLVIMIEYYLMTELELSEETSINIANEKVTRISQYRSYIDTIKTTNMNKKRRTFD